LVDGPLFAVSLSQYTFVTRSSWGSSLPNGRLAPLTSALLAGSCLCSAPALAQDAPSPQAPPPASVDGRQTYTPADFARFSPKTALDMLNQVPGFLIRSDDQGRGLGEASTNVLINGERVALKSESIEDRLQRISAEKVERIEIVDGATLGIPGLSGQVANIVTSGGGLTGQFAWKTRFRPEYVKPNWFGGNVSVSGASDRLEYSLALSNNAGRGAAKGPSVITDGAGAVIEERQTHIRNIIEAPKIAGSLKWRGPGSSVLNLAASYRWTIENSTDIEFNQRPGLPDRVRLYDPTDRARGYEISGDYEFALGPGRLKLIGLERYNHDRYREDFVYYPADGSPANGSRYTNVSESGEHIARAEYSWKMLGGDFQLATEAAFNRYNGEAHIYDLDASGINFIEVPFPAGTGGVTEDRYETVLTHGRQLSNNLSLQIGVGGEYSKIAQTGSRGLVRSFRRPKGSLSLAWKPEPGLDLSLKLARKVGQLSFGDFLARADIYQGNDNAGNVELVPPQSWELDLEAKKDLGVWGSATLTVFGRKYDDYIDVIPLPGGGESRGNIDHARLYGVELVSTIKLDALGFRGAKIDSDLRWQSSNIIDPVLGTARAFSNDTNRHADATLRHDIPGSDWAWGVGFQYDHVLPYYRLYEVGRQYEGPTYTYAFIENKDVFGLTVRAQWFNVANGRRIIRRTVYDGPRDTAPVLFVEDTNQGVGDLFDITVSGKF
jgi:hypothetical protein